MIWTILVLVLAIALFMFGGKLVKVDAKKPTSGAMIGKKVISHCYIVSVITPERCIYRYAFTHFTYQFMQYCILSFSI